MKQGLNPIALGIAGGGTSALGMLGLGILGNLNIYSGAVEMMKQWHLFFDLSLVGIVTGMVEAGVLGFVFMYVFALFYNRFSK
ncbi:MAG: hypothetical protein ACE5DX_04115 [Candidatus Dojkabacteria bacterium]